MLALFDRTPDCLSPDEQALAMGIRICERAGQDVLSASRELLAGMIESMALSHYARDIRGELALRDWEGIARELRERNAHAS